MNPSNANKFLIVKDYSVTKENFELCKDTELDLVYTHPQPQENQLSRYYESEDYISHTDGQRSLFEKVYQLVKNRTLKNKIKLINRSHRQKGNLLDIGAGTGDFLLAATKNGWNGKGIEPNTKAKAIAVKKGGAFVESTVFLHSNSFDVITMWHVLEHIPNLELQIKELKRLLKPNGTILIAVPNFNSFDAKYYGSYWAAYDVPRHLWHFSTKAITILFEREELQLEKVIPMRYDAFYVSLLSEKYKTGKMNYLSAFIIGIWSNFKAKQTLEYSSHIYVIKNSKR
ncbi:MAG: class I SAM-dependent methyltransferase [Burkholderiales bacterium]|nr:class I SAM-dependent methyltransferase [Flavobacterium sp.]